MLGIAKQRLIGKQCLVREDEGILIENGLRKLLTPPEEIWKMACFPPLEQHTVVYGPLPNLLGDGAADRTRGHALRGSGRPISCLIKCPVSRSERTRPRAQGRRGQRWISGRRMVSRRARKHGRRRAPLDSGWAGRVARHAIQAVLSIPYHYVCWLSPRHTGIRKWGVSSGTGCTLKCMRINLASDVPVPIHDLIHLWNP